MTRNSKALPTLSADDIIGAIRAGCFKAAHIAAHHYNSPGSKLFGKGTVTYHYQLRAVDRGLQNAKKKGLIAFVDGTWREVKS